MTIKDRAKTVNDPDELTPETDSQLLDTDEDDDRSVDDVA